MDSLQIIATQLEISRGLRRDRGEFLVDAEKLMPPPLLQRRGILYIITELEGRNRDNEPDGVYSQIEKELCHDVQMAMLKEFYEFNASASITSAMRHALEIANQMAFNRNSALLPPERRGVGATLAVVRGNELFLAQLPPTQAYVVHQGQLSFFPVRKRGPQLVTKPVQRETQPLKRLTATHPALGRYSSIDPIFNRTIFEDGDLLVLCSGPMVEALNEDQVERYFLNSSSREALYNLNDFARAKDITEGYALAVGVKGDYSSARLDEVAQERSEMQLNTTQPEDSGLRNAVEGVAATVSLIASKFGVNFERPSDHPEVFEASLASTEISSTRWQENKDLVDTKPRKAVSSTSARIYSEPQMYDDPNNDPWIRREGDDLHQPPYRNNPDQGFQSQQAGIYRMGNSPSGGNEGRPNTFRPGTYREEKPKEPPKSPQPAFDFGEENPPEEEERSRPVWGSAFRKAKGSRKAPAAEPVEELPYYEPEGAYEPEYGEIRPSRRRTTSLPNTRTLAIVGLVALLTIAVLFLVFAAVSNNSGNEKALNFVKAAEAKRSQAQLIAKSDPAGARKLIVAAQDDLANARKEKSDLKDITVTQNALKVTLDNINRVVMPPDVRLSRDLSVAGAGLKITRSVMAPTGDAVFLLDGGRGQVLLLDLQGQVKTILAPGDTASGKTFGKPVSMSPRLDSVMVADDSNQVWIYDRSSGKWSASVLGGTAAWSSSIKLMDTYQGNLYAIGPAGGQILRWLAGNYGSNPDEWLSEQAVQTAQLDKAAELAIDGNIYALSQNGMLYQLARPAGKSKGEVITQFDLNGGGKVGPAISNPKVLYVGTLDFPYVFVVDGNRRILQFQKSDGAFIQQFQSDGKEFDTINDLVVDETNQKIFVVGDQKIYVFKLPAAVDPGTLPVISASPVASPTTGR